MYKDSLVIPIGNQNSYTYVNQSDNIAVIEGLPYDLKGIIGLAAHEDWQEDDMFFCSEAKAYVMKFGAKYKGVDWSKYKLGRITPKINRSWKQTLITLDLV